MIVNYCFEIKIS